MVRSAKKKKRLPVCGNAFFVGRLRQFEGSLKHVLSVCVCVCLIECIISDGRYSTLSLGGFGELNSLVSYKNLDRGK